MKPAELQPLIGRMVDVFIDGERCGKVKAVPASNTFSVQVAGWAKRQRVPLDRVRGVFWRGKLEPVETFLARRAGAVA